MWTDLAEYSVMGLNEAAGAAVEKAVAAFACCLRGSRVFAVQPFRQEVF